MYKTMICLHITLLMNAEPEHLDFYQVILKRMSPHLRSSIHGQDLNQFMQDSFGWNRQQLLLAI